MNTNETKTNTSATQDRVQRLVRLLFETAAIFATLGMMSIASLTPDGWWQPLLVGVALATGFMLWRAAENWGKFIEIKAEDLSDNPDVIKKLKGLKIKAKIV